MNPLSSFKILSNMPVMAGGIAAGGYIILEAASYLIKNDIMIDRRILNRIMIKIFSNGSENFCIIVERI